MKSRREKERCSAILKRKRRGRVYDIRAYAAQDGSLTKMKGAMEEDQNTKRKEMMQSMRDYNLQLA